MIHRLSFISLCYFLILHVSSYAQNFSNVASIQGVQANISSIDNWGTGVSTYDFNQDGWDDLTFAVENDTQLIYINNQGSFERAHIKWFNPGETKAILWVDYDNDGNLDLFLSTKNAGLRLLRNDGNFNFTEQSSLAGLSINAAVNHGASWGDFDKDGFLDLYVCKYRGWGDATNLSHVNNLYHNNGDGTFTDVSFSSGTSNGIAPSYQSVWIDYNNDTWPDLLVVNDRYGFPNALYHNNGDGTFNDVAASLGIDENLNNFMSASVSDFDNDMDLDVYMSNTATPSPGLFDYPYLFTNYGTSGFANEASLYALELNKTSWGGLWLDYDNNGLDDLYVATSNIDTSLPIARNYFYINTYPGSFYENPTLFNGNHFAHSHAVGRLDFDNNGFYDIIASNEAPDNAFLWQNSGNVNNNYVKLTLEGTVSNNMAVGSWIYVYAQGNSYTQYTLCGESYLGQNSQHHIVGVASATLIDSIHVKYLSGIEDKYYNLDVNQHYHFVEGETIGSCTISCGNNTQICFGDTTTIIAPTFASYAWSTGDTTQEIQVTQGGIYSLMATDSNGLLYYSNPLEIEALPPVAISANVHHVSCANENDGAVALSVENENIPYTIYWAHGPIGDSLSQLAPAWYYYQYLDSLSCAVMDSLSITEPFPINVQTLVMAETPVSLGAIQLMINGGVAPYQILLDSVAVSEIMDSLSAGIYLLEVIDAKGCYWHQNVQLAFKDSSSPNALTLIEGAHLEIFPNPWSEKIKLQFKASTIEIFNLTLFDAMGKFLYQEEFRSRMGENTWELDLSSWSQFKHLYLQISTSEGIQIQNVLLMHE